MNSNRPSGDSTIASGRLPTWTWRPAGAIFHPFGRRVTPPPSVPGRRATGTSPYDETRTAKTGDSASDKIQRDLRTRPSDMTPPERAQRASTSSQMINLVDLLGLGGDGFRRSHACGDHHLTNRGLRVGRRLEIAESVADGNRQWRPPELVRPIPHVDPGAPGREELHHLGEVFVGCGMHGGLAVVVDRIHVGAEVQCHLEGLEHFALCPGVLAG